SAKTKKYEPSPAPKNLPKGKDQQSALYEDFWACGGEWTNSAIYKEITNSSENKKRGVRRWLTRTQMLPFFDNDPDIVDGIIARKLADEQLRESEVRDHPELPSVQQYLVLVQDEEEALECSRIADIFRLKDSGTGRDVSDSDASGSSDSESESGSSSSQSEEKKGKKKGKKGKVSKSKKSKKDKKGKKGKKEKNGKNKKKKKNRKKNKKTKKTPEEEEAAKRKEEHKQSISDLKKASSAILCAYTRAGTNYL
ncbi:Uncharacterized protein SCF082_LOCUS44188, partial [Durusdinium trenchii]